MKQTMAHTMSLARAIKMTLVLCTLFVAVGTANAQTLTNKGTLIYMAPKAVLTCCGTFNVNSNGMVVAEDSSRLIVKGTLNVSNGSVSLNKASTATVSQDLVTGGTCGTPTGTVLRKSPGVLVVDGFVNNKGMLTNFSLVQIGKDLNNDGELNNQSSSTIEIGP